MSNPAPWRDAATGARLTHHAAVTRLATARVVLVGERHDLAADHRWQALVIAGLAAHRPSMVVGFEMFSWRVQPALDDWVAGRLDLDAFLAATNWAETWGFDAALYTPLFHVCRDLALPMRALNIDRPLVGAIGRDGWDAVPPADRGRLSPARPAGADYRAYLFDATGGVRPGRAAQSPEDPAFDRFVRAQEAWDRAFACALADALIELPDALAVGVIGRGHLEFGYGVADQLDDLGVAPVLTALPGAARDAPDIADLVFEGGES